MLGRRLRLPLGRGRLAIRRRSTFAVGEAEAELVSASDVGRPRHRRAGLVAHQSEAAIEHALVGIAFEKLAQAAEIGRRLVGDVGARADQASGKVDRSAAAVLDRKSTRLNSSHSQQSRMPSSA